MAHNEPGGLLERGVELGVIRAGAEAVAAGQGRAIVVEGPAGIGKTALLAAARAGACEAGLRPLDARATELERAFGFGVARQLLEPAVAGGDPAALFEAPGARPRGAARRRGRRARPLPSGPEGAFVALHGLIVSPPTSPRPAAGAAGGRRAWCDGASLRFLAYLAGRIGQTPVMLVVAARPRGEPGGAAVAELLAEAGAPELLRPEALTDDAAASIVRAAVPRPRRPSAAAATR